MAETRLNMQLLLRRAKFADTCVLAAGEPGYHTGTKELKIGDGTSTWAQLGFANQTQIEALIKVVDDKVAALDGTYATDKEVEDIRAALQAAIDTKLAAETFNTYSATRQLTDTEINTAIGNVDAKFASYRTSADQDVIDNGIKGRLDTLEAKPFDTYATKTEVEAVAGDLTEYETVNNARVKAIEDEIDGFNYADATATTEALNARYTKSEADAKFETIANVDLVRADVTNITKEGGLIATAKSEAIAAAKTETETQIATFKTTVVDPIDGRLGDVEEQLATVSNVMDFVGAGATLPAADASNKGDVFVINEGDNAGKEYVFDGTAWVEFGYATGNENAIAALQDALAQEVTDRTDGDTALGGRIDTLSGTVTDNKNTYDAYVLANNDRVKAVEDAIAALDETYATDDELADAVDTINGELDKKLDKATFDAFNNGTSKDVAAIEADIVAKANAAESAAKAYTDEKTAGYTATDADYAIAGATKDIEIKGVNTDIIGTDCLSLTTVTNTGSISIHAGQDDTADIYLGKKIVIEHGTGNAYYVVDQEFENPDAREYLATENYADDAAAQALADAKAYADEKEHKDTTYTAAATANALEFTLTPSEGDAQTITLVAPTVDTGVMAVIAAENDDVTATTDGSTVTVAHKAYQTGTIKAAEETEEPNFLTSVTIANGHVTGASVQTLSAALASMTFILDGGTSAN